MLKAHPAYPIIVQRLSGIGGGHAAAADGQHHVEPADPPGAGPATCWHVRPPRPAPCSACGQPPPQAWTLRGLVRTSGGSGSSLTGAHVALRQAVLGGTLIMLQGRMCGMWRLWRARGLLQRAGPPPPPPFPPRPLSYVPLLAEFCRWVV